MPYTIPLSPVGQQLYKDQDPDVERAVIYLVERMGIDAWKQRRQAIHDRFKRRLTLEEGPGPVEGVSVRDREDEIAWYLFLAETSIGDPTALETDQANRILPYIAAFGRKLDAILAIEGAETRIDRLLRRVANQDPDQAIFELLIGSSYVLEGWRVVALPESAKKTPDFLVERDGVRFEVECKRFARRGEYTQLERDAWLRLWTPARLWLNSQATSLVFTVELHVEIASLPGDYLREIVERRFEDFCAGRPFHDIGVCTIRSTPVDLGRISHHLEHNWVKLQTPFERQLLTGRYERDYGITYFVGGRPVSLGEPTIAGNRYWEEIDYVLAAYWRCDAPAAREAKARDIRKRLADAAEQLSGEHQGVVHLGIETADGDDVELVRSNKILNTIQKFDPRGKPLHWIYLHFFRSESLPTGTWAFDETCQWHGILPAEFRPLEASFVIGPEDAPGREGKHWEAVM